MIDKKRYCLDTSGLSNPLDSMPESIAVYRPIWQMVSKSVESGIFAVTKEIYEELCRLPGSIGKCLQDNKDNLLLEVDQPWNWQEYINNVNGITTRHKPFISEYNKNIKGTIGVIDVSIVALAKTLNIPVVSMETRTHMASSKRIKIPDLCDLEKVEHLIFNDLIERI